jgi:hypothetical protein
MGTTFALSPMSSASVSRTCRRSCPIRVSLSSLFCELSSTYSKHSNIYTTHAELFILVRSNHALINQKLFNERRLPPDLKPSNILLLPSNIDSIVMHELAELPSTLYELPKTILPEEVPFHAVSSAPLIFTPNLSHQSEASELHWVIADFGHGTCMQMENTRARGTKCQKFASSTSATRAYGRSCPALRSTRTRGRSGP